MNLTIDPHHHFMSSFCNWKFNFHILKTMHLDLICQSPEMSYYYAEYVLDGNRFELGEKIIATCKAYSYMYAEFVLHGPFLIGEKVISTDGYYSALYAKYILNSKLKIKPKIMPTDMNPIIWDLDMHKGQTSHETV